MVTKSPSWLEAFTGLLVLSEGLLTEYPVVFGRSGGMDDVGTVMKGNADEFCLVLFLDRPIVRSSRSSDEFAMEDLLGRARLSSKDLRILTQGAPPEAPGTTLPSSLSRSPLPAGSRAGRPRRVRQSKMSERSDNTDVLRMCPRTRPDFVLGCELGPFS
eukprot:1709026-Pyramimonas_sp.AAC.1